MQSADKLQHIEESAGLWFTHLDQEILAGFFSASPNAGSDG